MPRLTCPSCAKERNFKGAPGATLPCPNCGVGVEIPKPEAREVTCPSCQATQATGAAPGRKVTCKSCQESFRVPLRDGATAREVTCEDCGSVQSTTTAPGRRLSCKTCEAEIRVPLREEGGGGNEVTCPHCGARRETPAPPGQKTRCRDCGEKFRVPLEGSAPGTLRQTSACQVCDEEFPRSWDTCPNCEAPRSALKEELMAGDQARLIGWAIAVALLIFYLTLVFVVFQGEIPIWLHPKFLVMALITVLAGTELVRRVLGYS